VKVALIRDTSFFAWLREHRDELASFQPSALDVLIRRAAEIHLQHITRGGDPFELGSARPLDFGHWAAHKLESLTAHRLRHGEAVAIGMALDTRYAALTGLLEEQEADAVITLLESLGFRLWDDALVQRDARDKPAVLQGLADFREHLGGELTVTLLSGIGRTRDVHEMHERDVLQAVDDLRARHERRCV
jgi:3-dehydroquinate synthase